jgi:RNA polymerase sigma-70 factor, ECF subfamily
MTFGPNDELRELLLACSKRDQSAFARLYEATSAKLFGVALRMLRREDWAEEVLQDCFISIWNNAASYSASLSAPMTWMTSIVRNRCLDWLRRPRIEIQMTGDQDAVDGYFDSVPSETPGPFELIQSKSDARALTRCLEQLDGKQRDVIVLAFYEGLTHTELATRLQHPLGTVKTWVRRGLAQLRDCLA